MPVRRGGCDKHANGSSFMVMVMNRPDCEDEEEEEEEDRECGEEGRAYLHGHQLVLSAADSSASS